MFISIKLIPRKYFNQLTRARKNKKSYPVKKSDQSVTTSDHESTTSIVVVYRDKLSVARVRIQRHPPPMRSLLLFFFLVFPTPLLPAQDAVSDPPTQTSSPERKLSSLKTIAEPLSASLAEIASLQNELEVAPTEDAKQEIQNKIDAERERLKGLRQSFRDIVGGSEAAEYQEVTPESATLQVQISDLVQPVLSALREATSEPRELDALKKRLEVAKERERKSDLVLERIDTLVSQTEDEDTVSELESTRKVWSSRLAEARSQIAVPQSSDR